MMMFSWRMHGISGESRTYDVIEKILYNHCLGALSPDHTGNFYYNPLRRVGDLTGKTDHGGDPVRRTMLPRIHSTTCCLPNAWRFFAQLPEYVFAARGNQIQINLYTDAVGHHRMDGGAVDVEIKTRYPHDGQVEIVLKPTAPAVFTVKLRIPGWCTEATARVDGGESMRASGGRYCDITREWRPGDRVLLNLPMLPVAVHGAPEVEADRGQAAFRRGPLVYCLESQDARGLDLERTVVVLNRENPSTGVREVPDSTRGYVALEVRAGERSVAQTQAGTELPTKQREVRLIPFYDRANRDVDTRWITWIPCTFTPP
jgi:DUF1680 family protein